MKKIYLFTILILVLIITCTSNKKNRISAAFVELETNSEVSLRGLHVVNEKIIWASGSNGSVLKSTDGGENWKTFRIEGEEKNDFRSIHAWNKNRVLVFGVAGPKFGYLSENGGENWEVVFQDSTSGLFFNSLKFADEKNGLAVSDPIDGRFFIIRTNDAGKTWQRTLEIPETFEGEANFAASNTCIEYLPSGKAWIASGGKEARVFYSNNFGKIWQVSNTPIIKGKTSSGIFSISFKNDVEGVIVGGIYDQPENSENIAAYTKDGGKTWLPANNMPKEYRSCVQTVSTRKDKFEFAIGKTGCDYSFDKGINWNYLNDSGFYTFRQIPGELEGLVAGANGRISKVEFIRK